MRRRAGRGLLLAVGLLLAAVPAPGRAAPAAQPAGLSMTVAAGYDGHYKLGDWFPVQVTLTNGGPALDAEVQVSATGPNDQAVATFARQVTLPAPAHKQVTLATYASTYQHALAVRLVREGTVLLEQQVALDPLSGAFLLGAVSDTPDLLNGLSGTNLGQPAGAGRATVAHLAPADLPASAPALGGLDALVFANTDSGRLSPEARQAIAAWVVAGGTLVVAGGDTWQTTGAGLADLLPVQFSGSAPAADLGPLGTFAGGAAPLTAGAVASTGRVLAERGGTAVVGTGSSPLVARRPLGAGEVYALAVDPSQPPLSTWAQSSAFWTRLLTNHTNGLSPAAARRMGSGVPGGPALYSGPAYAIGQLSPFDLPGLSLPPVGVVGGFLLLYVLCVGPLNYLVLRRRRRTELAWITIPAVIVVFAVAAYGLGYSSKGGQVILSTATVIQGTADAPVSTAASFVGLFSPNRQTYDLDFPGAAQIAEVNVGGQGGLGSPASGPPTIYEDQPSRVAGLNVDTWSLRGFLAETTVLGSSPYRAQLAWSQNLVLGQVTNGGPAPLRDVAVVSEHEVQILGTLAPGQSAAVHITSLGSASVDLQAALPQLVPGVQLNTWPQSSNTQEQAGRRRAALLSLALGGASAPAAEANVAVVGWADGTPIDVQIPGQHPVRDNLVLVTARLPIQAQPGSVLLGPAEITRAVTAGSAQVEPGTDGPLLRVSGSATFTYQLPPDVHVAQISLDYALDTGSSYVAPLRVEVYNWPAARWDDLADSSGQAIGVGRSYLGDIGAPATYVSPRGQVQVRVRPYGTNADVETLLDRLDLHARGTR